MSRNVYDDALSECDRLQTITTRLLDIGMGSEVSLLAEKIDTLASELYWLIDGIRIEQDDAQR